MGLNARGVFRAAAIVLLFLLCLPLQLLTRRLLRPSPLPPWFLRAVGRIVGLRVTVAGQPLKRHSLVVANHVSWLDILVLGGWAKSALVSKDELGHPMVHWLADQNDTIYVKRSHVRGARDQALALARALEGDKPVTVFPEGTTGPGTHLLPFRSTLLEAANFAAKDVEVRPAAVDYGSAAPAIAWWQELGKSNVLRILNRAGTLPVRVHILGSLDRSGDRKQLARDAQAAIARDLGFKLPPQSPIAPSE